MANRQTLGSRFEELKKEQERQGIAIGELAKNVSRTDRQILRIEKLVWGLIVLSFSNGVPALINGLKFYVS